MKPVMYKKDTVKAMIAAGKKFLLAADEKSLRDLPPGFWIAGTIPYFMAEQGGLFTQDQIYVTELPDDVVKAEIKVYDETTVHQIYTEAPQHGFSVVIIPGSSPTHLTFALNAPNFPDFATRPLVGWISGVAVDERKVTPKVFDGRRGQALENGAVVMHVELPATRLVEVGIVNIFKQGEGDTLIFPRDGFSATDVLLDGKVTNFADYLADHNIDIKLPLVADLYGAMINTSFKSVDLAEKRVHFYAPVFAGLRYKIAEPVNDYVGNFLTQVPEGVGDNLFFSCNCILNYLYVELAGKKTANFTGPITFGEIAYQLLNQTLVYLTIEDAS